MPDSPSPSPEVTPSLAPCPECGGACTPARVASRVHIQRQDVILGGLSGLRAVVCMACGYTGFYARTPQVLWGTR